MTSTPGRPMTDLLLRAARLPGGTGAVDIAVGDGRITTIVIKRGRVVATTERAVALHRVH